SPLQGHPQERQCGGFSRLQISHLVPQLALDLGLDLDHETSIEIRIENLGMDIALTANRCSVPEARGYAFDRRAQVPLGLSCAVEALQLLERKGRKHRRCPGPKILGRYAL